MQEHVELDKAAHLFGAMVDEVALGRRFMLMKDGTPVAVLGPPPEDFA